MVHKDTSSNQVTLNALAEASALICRLDTNLSFLILLIYCMHYILCYVLQISWSFITTTSWSYVKGSFMVIRTSYMGMNHLPQESRSQAIYVCAQRSLLDALFRCSYSKKTLHSSQFNVKTWYPTMVVHFSRKTINVSRNYTNLM